MKLLFICALICSSLLLANTQTPEEFVKSEMEKMLNGEEIALLKTTNDYYPTIFITDKFVMEKVTATQTKKQIKYFKVKITFETQERIEQDLLHQQQTQTKAKVELKNETSNLIFYFKREKLDYKWTSKLEEVYVRKEKVQSFLN
jgi:hypothetical protein